MLFVPSLLSYIAVAVLLLFLLLLVVDGSGEWALLVCGRERMGVWMGVGRVEWRWGMTIVIPNPDEYSFWWSVGGLPLEVTTTMLLFIMMIIVSRRSVSCDENFGRSR